MPASKLVMPRNQSDLPGAEGTGHGAARYPLKEAPSPYQKIA
jgi:hypothetical protein